MGWIGRIVVAVVAAVIAYIVCVVLVTFLPDLPPIGAQLAGIIARFTLPICVIVFLYFLFVGYARGPWSGVRL
jgi:hypothetical protein